jgi:hypothetical protein
MSEHFWPFVMLKFPSEWNRLDRDFVRFMQTAYVEGYRPRT